MKKNKLLMLTILVGILLTSCSSVFDASINGKVVDDESGNGIENMAVYAYDSESARDAAYNRYNSQEDKSVFVDSSVPSANTDQNGNFYISPIRWKTNSPSFGKDGDTTTVYLLFFNEEYGMNKSNEGYVVYSDNSRDIGIFSFESIWETKTVNLRMLDGAFDSNNNITDVIEYTVKYYDGNEEVVLHQNTTSFVVRYRNTIKEDFKVYISDIVVNPSSSKSQWNHTVDKENGTLSNTHEVTIDINSDKETIYDDMYFKKKYLIFPGISGYLYTPGTNNTGIGNDTDDGLMVSIYNGAINLGASDITECINTGIGNTTISDHGYYENVGLKAEINIEYLNEESYEMEPIKLTVKYVDYVDEIESQKTLLKTIEFKNNTSQSELSGLKLDRTKTHENQ